MEKFIKYLAIIGLIFVSFGVSLSARAAGFSLVASTSTVQENERFSVSVFLDAEGESVNAAEGRVSFPQASLDFISAYESDSVINLWLQSPHQDGEGTVVWSGIIPGGFKGILSPYYQGFRPGKIFSLIFKAKKTGNVALSISNVKALLNDGNGTTAYVHSSGANLTISPSVQSGGQTSPSQIFKDKIPPIQFIPQIARDESIFGGSWFIVFVTQDKETGVEHYEVLESRKQKIENGRWETAESPYPLKDQSLKSWIYVKATDHAGNSYIAEVPPENPLKWYKMGNVWGIIILGIIFLFIAIKTLWKK